MLYATFYQKKIMIVINVESIMSSLTMKRAIVIM